MLKSHSNTLSTGFAIFIDLKKAFDTVDHKLILQKPAKYGVDHNVLN